jgi:hypothetical protein
MDGVLKLAGLGICVWALLCAIGTMGAWDANPQQAQEAMQVLAAMRDGRDTVHEVPASAVRVAAGAARVAAPQQATPIQLGNPQAAAENWVRVATAWGEWRITQHAYQRHAEVGEIADALRNGWKPTRHHCTKNGRDLLVGLVFRAGAKAGTWALVVLENEAVAAHTIVTMFYPQPLNDPRQQLERIIETMERDGCQGWEQFDNMLHYRWAIQ